MPRRNFEVPHYPIGSGNVKAAIFTIQRLPQGIYDLLPDTTPQGLTNALRNPLRIPSEKTSANAPISEDLDHILNAWPSLSTAACQQILAVVDQQADHALDQVIEAWAVLPDALKAGIVAMVNAAKGRKE